MKDVSTAIEIACPFRSLPYTEPMRGHDSLPVTFANARLICATHQHLPCRVHGKVQHTYSEVPPRRALRHDTLTLLSTVWLFRLELETG